jgi:hypothetical protein
MGKHCVQLLLQASWYLACCDKTHKTISFWLLEDKAESPRAAVVLGHHNIGSHSLAVLQLSSHGRWSALTGWLPHQLVLGHSCFDRDYTAAVLCLRTSAGRYLSMKMLSVLH